MQQQIKLLAACCFLHWGRINEQMNKWDLSFYRLGRTSHYNIQYTDCLNRDDKCYGSKIFLSNKLFKVKLTWYAPHEA